MGLKILSSNKIQAGFEEQGPLWRTGCRDAGSFGRCVANAELECRHLSATFHNPPLLTHSPADPSSLLASLLLAMIRTVPLSYLRVLSSEI